MKLSAYIALVCGASAIKLSHKHTPVAHKLIKVAHKVKQSDHVNELEAAIAGELANGGTITKEEAHGYAVDMGVPEGMMDELEAGFDAMDTNGDGELDAGEVEAAMEYMGLDEDVQFPSEEEIKAAIEAELERDGGITKEEAAGAIAHWADSQGVTIPQEAWDIMEAAFDEVDANGDGELTADEIAAAFEEGAEGAKQGKKGGKKGPKPGALLKLRIRNKKPSKEEMKALEDWAKAELSNGGTITAQEAYDKAVELGASDDDLAKIAEGFQMVDTSGDGEIDLAEAEAAIAAVEGQGQKGPKGGALLKMKNKLKLKVKAKQGPPEGVNEFEAWAADQLADGGTITKQEGYEKMVEMGVPESMMDEIEAGFDAVDTNGDGELDAGEVEAAMDHMGIDEDVQFPTEEELHDFVVGHLEADGDLSKEEAAAGIAAWADSQGVTIPQEAWDILEAMFDEVDTNGDGALTEDELQAAFEATEEAEGPKKGGKKGKKGPKGGALLKLRKH